MMKELKNKNETELKKTLAEKREEIRQTRFGMAGSATRNTKATKVARKLIARILTEQKLRKVASQSKAS